MSFDIRKMAAKLVPVDALKKASFQPKSRTEQEKVSDLEKALRNGSDLVYPIVVDNGFNVIDGHRRAFVLKKLGYKEVPCFIIDEDQAEKFAELNGTHRAMTKKDNQKIFLSNPNALSVRSRSNQQRAFDFLGEELYASIVIEDKITATSLVSECGRARTILKGLPMAKAVRISNIELARKILAMGQSLIRAIQADPYLNEAGKANRLMEMLKIEKGLQT